MSFTAQTKPGFVTDWSSSTSYIVGDKAKINFDIYTCILNHTNNTPPNGTYWTLQNKKTALPASSFTKTAKP